MALVVSGSSNAVNLTDGLDGLAAGLTGIAAVTFGVLAYVTGRVDMSRYLGLFYLPGSGELAIFALALAGGALGFLASRPGGAARDQGGHRRQRICNLD